MEDKKEIVLLTITAIVIMFTLFNLTDIVFVSFIYGLSLVYFVLLILWRKYTRLTFSFFGVALLFICVSLAFTLYMK